MTRAVVWNQLLWTAGHPLTSGGFLLYFSSELGAKGFVTALLLTLPELVGVGAVGTRSLVAAVRRRKRVWGVTAVAARIVSLGIPLMAFPALRPAGDGAMAVLVVALAVSQLLQSISYVAYLSWLSDLVPEERWGRFFATRTLARIAVQLIVPVAVAFARDRWVKGLPPQASLAAYVTAFVCGTLLQLASLVPMLRLPEASRPNESVRSGRTWSLRGLGGSLWLLLISNAWLAFSNGLTQAAFFQYRRDVLGISLGTYFLLENTMWLLMAPLSVWAGRVSDRRGDKWLLFWGMVVAAGAMPFWFFATPERWQLLFGAQVMWAAFAAVNLAGYNLLLKLSPRGTNTLQLALYQQGGGLIAGLAGLLGGAWLHAMLRDGTTIRTLGFAWSPYLVVFAASALGRVTAPLWVLPIREPARRLPDAAESGL